MLASILNCAKHLQKIGVLSVYIHALPMSKFDHYYLSWVSLRLPPCKPSAAVCIVWEDILLLLTNHCLNLLNLLLAVLLLSSNFLARKPLKCLKFYPMAMLLTFMKATTMNRNSLSELSI